MQGNDLLTRGRRRMRVVLGLSCAALMTSSVAASPALADLPLGYDVARHDSPFPGPVSQYPLGLANAGDLNGDGKEDYITAQLVNTRNDQGVISASGNGAIYIISAANGDRIKTIEAPDPGGSGNRANFAFPWISKIGTNRTAPAPFTDLARCSDPPPNAGELCRAATIGPPDGVPEIVVGARGVDAKGFVDSGRVYIYDGATFALLKRVDAPASDVTALALSRSGGNWYGRAVINPASLPPCAGNAGIGTCDNPPTPACPPTATTVECENIKNTVVRGDMDGGGLPDFVISGSQTSEDSTTAHPASHCALNPGSLCSGAGRLYVYRGEDVVGSSPNEILDGTVPAGGKAETLVTIRHPDAQADNTNPTDTDTEQIGNYLIPIGDVGECRSTPTSPLPAPGEHCPRANSVTTTDGRPEYIAGVAAQDLPLDNPDPNFADAGIAYLIDGKTHTILQTYRNPEPLAASRFSSVDVGMPSGDLGDTTLPDALIGTPGQISDGVYSAGAAYSMNGNFKTGIANIMFARMDDPSPVPSGNFGSAYTGVGDLVVGPATPANEVLVGGGGGQFGIGPKAGIFADMHFINGATGKVLQSIADPDNQPASQFGGKIIPLGDLNGDGFLDFAAAARLYDSATTNDAGRVYVFTSNNTPPPAPPPPPPAAAAPPAPPPPPPPPAAPTSASSQLQPGRCANDLRGTSDGDSLIGTTAGDAIFALDGDDVIEALAGHDCVDAGADEDDITGAAGNDSLLGGGANDQLDGGPGADRLFGQTGNDQLTAGSGRDMLAGGEGNDKLTGGAGGADRLYGERGNDQLTAGDSAANLLDGGSGNDRIDAVNGRRDTIRCGPGNDRATIDRIDRASGCERTTRKRA